MLPRLAIFIVSVLIAVNLTQERRPSPPPAAASGPERPIGARETCATRSLAEFAGAFTNRANLVVGPLAMIGAGAYTPPAVVREFGGNKFPVLVRAGHRVMLELSPATRRTAALGYGLLPQGELRVADGHRVVTFVACKPSIDSGSDADGAPVTFWSGFLLADTPQCVRLRVWVDRERAPRRAAVPLGRRC